MSIIVPNYNHEKYLRQRINSILNQSFSNFEIIILDDCSTDSSLNLLAELAINSKVSHYLINNKNSGSPFRQWKKGVELAKGKFIWIAETDDWASDDFLIKMTAIFESNPSVGIAYCQSIAVDEGGEKIHDMINHTERWGWGLWNKSFKAKGVEIVKNYMATVNVIPNASGVMFKKELFEKLNDDYLMFKFNGDWLVWIQMLKYCDVYFLNERLNFFRYHPLVTRIRNTSEKIAQVIKEQYYIIDFIDKNFYLNKNKVNDLYQGLLHQVQYGLNNRFYFSREGIQFLTYNHKRDSKFLFRFAMMKIKESINYFQSVIYYTSKKVIRKIRIF